MQGPVIENLESLSVSKGKSSLLAAGYLNIDSDNGEETAKISMLELNLATNSYTILNTENMPTTDISELVLISAQNPESPLLAYLSTSSETEETIFEFISSLKQSNSVLNSQPSYSVVVAQGCEPSLGHIRFSPLSPLVIVKTDKAALNLYFVDKQKATVGQQVQFTSSAKGEHFLDFAAMKAGDERILVVVACKTSLLLAELPVKGAFPKTLTPKTTLKLLETKERTRFIQFSKDNKYLLVATANENKSQDLGGSKSSKFVISMSLYTITGANTPQNAISLNQETPNSDLFLNPHNFTGSVDLFKLFIVPASPIPNSGLLFLLFPSASTAPQYFELHLNKESKTLEIKEPSITDSQVQGEGKSALKSTKSLE